VLGATRCIQLGSQGIQPSEVAKILLVLALAKLLGDNEKRLGKFRFYPGQASSS